MKMPMIFMIGIPVVVLCVLGACSVQPSASAIQTAIAQTQVAAPTEVPSVSPMPTDTPTAVPTLAPSPSFTASPVPTSTPEPTKTPTSTFTPTKVIPTTRSTATRPTVAATNPPAASTTDDKFYVGYSTCIGGTDVVHFLVGNSPGEIIEAYNRDRYNFTSTKQCEESFWAKVDALKQVHVCVLSLPEPTNGDLKTIRQSSILALADLIKIREADFADRLCAQDKRVLSDDARRAFENAQKHLQYAQTMLDQYRREHGK